MIDFLGCPMCGIFGGCAPTCVSGAAAQQQASVEYWRQQQEGMRNAYQPTPEQQAEWERWSATKRHVEAVRLEHGPDWAFWYWLCGLVAAAGIWRLVFR